MLCPDLHILTNDEHWTVTPATHKFAAAAGILFSDYGDRRTTGYKQFDYAKCAAMTVPQGSDRQIRNQRHAGTLYGHLWTSRRSKSPKCGLVHKKKRQPRKYENTSSILLERNTSSGHRGLTMRVFDLVDLRKFKPKNYATGRWVFTIKTDKQGNVLRAKARWVLRGFQDKQKEYLRTDSPASARPGFRLSCQMTASKS